MDTDLINYMMITAAARNMLMCKQCFGCKRWGIRCRNYRTARSFQVLGSVEREIVKCCGSVMHFKTGCRIKQSSITVTPKFINKVNTTPTLCEWKMAICTKCADIYVTQFDKFRKKCKKC